MIRPTQFMEVACRCGHAQGCCAHGLRGRAHLVHGVLLGQDVDSLEEDSGSEEGSRVEAAPTRPVRAREAFTQEDARRTIRLAEEVPPGSCLPHHPLTPIAPWACSPERLLRDRRTGQ